MTSQYQPDRYITDGNEIYRRSFAMIREESDLSAFTPEQATIAVRMIHAAGDTSVAEAIEFSPDAVAAGRRALQAGAPIYTDVTMVATGITRRRLPADNAVHCLLKTPGIAQRAAEIGNTRSAAAIDLALQNMAGAVVAIGNAPTALFYLLDRLAADPSLPRPAVIVGIPVGFVGAAESKAELAERAAELGVEYITVHGRRGGSAMTVAALNALGCEQEILGGTVGSTAQRSAAVGFVQKVPAAGSDSPTAGAIPTTADFGAHPGYPDSRENSGDSSPDSVPESRPAGSATSGAAIISVPRTPLAGAAHPGTLYGVGLGPGDSALVTVAAAQIIATADVVAVHAGTHGRSTALSIAQPYLRPTTIVETLHYPVTTGVDRQIEPGQTGIERIGNPITDYDVAMAEFYREATERLAAHLRAGRSVAILSLGDPMLYSSYQHLHRALEDDFPTVVIPGVASVTAAAAAVGRPLAEDREVLSIIPGTVPYSDLVAALRSCHGAVIMKLGRTFPTVRKALEETGLAERAVVVSRATMDSEQVQPLTEVDSPPYFSVVLVPSQVDAAARELEQS